MSICLFAGGKAITVAASLFTLSWTHSVEKIRWEEDWRLTPAGLEIVEARVRGTGAGMEIPGDAVLKDGAWAYRPRIAPQAEVVLAQSGATVGGWRICGEEQCRDFGAGAGGPVSIRACASKP
jgi:hypothetical protein